MCERGKKKMNREEDEEERRRERKTFPLFINLFIFISKFINFV